MPVDLLTKLIEQFQYIKCGGSAQTEGPFTVADGHFNTSNVEVPLLVVCFLTNQSEYFNTSNVEVPLPPQVLLP